MKPPEQLRWRLLQRPIPIVEIPWHSSLMERRSCNSLNTVLAWEKQELALAAAEGIAGLDNVLIFSVASDGTDGSTDAVGGIVDRFTWSRLEKAGLSIHQILANNSAYHALKQVDGLIRTGPIGTNVNDVLVLLIQQAERT